MNSGHKQRLLELGAERLADALLELASRDHGAEELVERMIATPQESIERFKKRLAGIKRSRRFIRWGESAAFARELQELLRDVEAGVSDPRTGAELVASFYGCDKGALGTATTPAAMSAMFFVMLRGSSSSASLPGAMTRRGSVTWCSS